MTRFVPLAVIDKILLVHTLIADSPVCSLTRKPYPAGRRFLEIALLAGKDAELGEVVAASHANASKIPPCIDAQAIHIPSTWMVEIPMAGNVVRFRDRAVDTEKLTINIGFFDLGRIDLLVQDAFYSNRSDFIRTAIRNQLAAHAPEVKKSIVRQTLELGIRHYSRADLEVVKTAGERLRIKVLGLASIADDVSPALALSTIESITVLGAFHASNKLKAALADRLH